MKKIILPIVPILSLFAGSSKAQEEGALSGLRSIDQRAMRISLRIPIRNGGFYEQDYIDILKSNGIKIDDYSRILSHEEEGVIDLRCFNCIIKHRNFNEALSSPENDIIREK